MLKKFIIGTAQFTAAGMVFQTPLAKDKTKEVEKILSLLEKKKYFIDTSTNYGKAEKKF